MLATAYNPGMCRLAPPVISNCIYGFSGVLCPTERETVERGAPFLCAKRHAAGWNEEILSVKVVVQRKKIRGGTHCMRRNYIKALACFLAAALTLLNVPGMGVSAAEPENPGNGGNECICGTRCAEDTANGNCPVCGGTDADLSLCRGEEPDAAVENVQKLIDALPAAGELSAMSQAEQQTVYSDLYEAYDAYNALSDEQKQQESGATIFDSLFEAFNKMNTPMVDGDREVTTGGTYTCEQLINGLMTGESLIFNGDADTPFVITGSLILPDGVFLEIKGGNVSVQGNVTVVSNSLTISGGTLYSEGDVTVESGSLEISGGTLYSEGNVTVKSGSLTLSGGMLNVGGIFSSDSPNLDNGVVFTGIDGKVYGNVQIPDEVIIPNGYTLTIPDSAGLTIPEGVKLTNNGTIVVESGGTLTVNGDVDGTGNLTNNGGTVNRKKRVQPAAPVLSGTAAADSINIQSAAGQMYTITETNDTPEVSADARAAIWKRADGGSLTFSNLKAGTTYYIWTYIPGNDYYEDSPVSPALSVITLKESEGGETTEGDGGGSGTAVPGTGTENSSGTAVPGTGTGNSSDAGVSGTKSGNGDTRYGKNVQTGVEEDNALWAGLLAASALLGTLSVIACRKRKA